MMTQQWKWPVSERMLQYAAPAAAFLLSLLSLLLVRRFLVKWLYRRANPESFGCVALDAMRFPALLWCIAGALRIALETSTVPEKYIGRATTAIIAFLIISLSMVLASAASRALALHGQRRGVALEVSGLSRTLTRVIIYLFGGTALLRLYQVNITPLLATLGVGGLAVALALQDTLANFFAGIHILIEAPIALGNAIRLTDGQEGVVTDIGWRTTRVRTGGNNIIVVPNTRITSGILINYSLPEARVGVDLPVLVAHTADPDDVMRIALGETTATDGVLPVPEPKVFFNPGVLPTHLQFTVNFSVADFTRQAPVQSEVRRRIHRRLVAEGVPLPKVEIR